MPPPASILLQPDSTLLVVVDMQSSFLRVMHNPDALTANVRLLVQSAGILGVPVVTTTQNASRLGGVAPAVADVLPPDALAPIDKMTFSCADSQAFMSALQSASRSQILLCGVETHICVSQTAQGLRSRGFQVHVAADAVSSRTMEKHKLGMERIRDGGAIPCAAEAAVYELLSTGDSPAFKQILPLVK